MLQDTEIQIDVYCAQKHPLLFIKVCCVQAEKIKDVLKLIFDSRVCHVVIGDQNKNLGKGQHCKYFKRMWMHFIHAF